MPRRLFPWWVALFLVATPAFSYDRADLSGKRFEVDRFQGGHTRERLHDAGHAQRGASAELLRFAPIHCLADGRGQTTRYHRRRHP